MKTLIDQAKPLRIVCHKAFDETPNAEQALDALI
jgi:copper homeostasis protein CutC